MTTLRCPHCGRSVDNDLSLAGQSAACPSCGKNILFPNLLEVPELITTRPQSNTSLVAARRHHRPESDKMAASEAFRRGFWGGFGLWCSFMALNIIFGIVALVVLTSLGIILSASSETGVPQHIGQTPKSSSVSSESPIYRFKTDHQP